MATEDDLTQTVKEVEALGRRIFSAVADVRDAAGLRAAVAEGVDKLGGLEIVRLFRSCFGRRAVRSSSPARPPGSRDSRFSRPTSPRNTVHPTGVDTPLLAGLGGMDELIGLDPATSGIFVNTLPVELVQPRDISNAVLFLASDEARYVTGLEFTVDAGCTIR